MIVTGKNRRVWRKTCPNATVFTINPTWTDPDVNPGLYSENPESNFLSHGRAKVDS
jgi:hypothetical protein